MGFNCIENGSYVKLILDNGEYLDGIISLTCVSGWDNGKLDCAFVISQQEDSAAEPFGDALIFLSDIKKLEVVKYADYRYEKENRRKNFSA